MTGSSCTAAPPILPSVVYPVCRASRGRCGNVLPVTVLRGWTRLCRPPPPPVEGASPSATPRATAASRAGPGGECCEHGGVPAGDGDDGPGVPHPHLALDCAGSGDSDGGARGAAADGGHGADGGAWGEQGSDAAWAAFPAAHSAVARVAPRLSPPP